MRNIARNRVAEIPVSREYIDDNLNTWEYKAYVLISYDGEIQDTRISFLEGFDASDKPINTLDFLTQTIIDGIKDQAGRRALERIESVDFEQESERE